MIDARVFDEFSQQLSKLLPPGAAELKADFEKNSRTVLQNALTKMDLVTREEFDVQAAVLNKTRSALNDLEQRIAQMEAAQQQPNE